MVAACLSAVVLGLMAQDSLGLSRARMQQQPQYTRNSGIEAGGAQEFVVDSELTDTGYNSIVALRNDKAMGHWVQRLLAAEDKFIPQDQEGELAGFVPWFSGTKATQSLQELRQELSKKSWVKDLKTIDGSTLGEADYQAVAALRNDTAMKMFVRAVLRSESLFIPRGQEGMLDGFVQWFSGQFATQSFSQLRQEVSAIDWAKDLKSLDGTRLSEADYQGVVDSHNDTAMKLFVRSLLRGADKFIPQDEEGKLDGLVPWFSGTRASQSLEKLRAELSAQPWVKTRKAISGADSAVSALSASRNREEVRRTVQKATHKDVHASALQTSRQEISATAAQSSQNKAVDSAAQTTNVEDAEATAEKESEDKSAQAETLVQSTTWGSKLRTILSGWMHAFSEAEAPPPQTETELDLPAHADIEEAPLAQAETEADLLANAGTEDSLPAAAETEIDLPAHADIEEAPPAQADTEADFPAHVDIEEVPSAQAETETDLPAHADTEDSLPAQAATQLDLPTRADIDEAPPAQAETEADLPAHVDIQEAPPAHADTEADLPAHVDIEEVGRGFSEAKASPAHADTEADLPALRAHADIEAAPPARAEIETALISPCSDCIVWGNANVLSFNAYRSLAAEHPNQAVELYVHEDNADQFSGVEKGTYWLVHNDDMQIQGHYWRYMDKEALNTGLGAIAIGGPMVGNQTLVITPKHGKVMWNDMEILHKEISEFSNEFVTADSMSDVGPVAEDPSAQGIKFSFSNGLRLTVARHSQTLSARINLCDADVGAGPIVGQCGNFEATMQPGSEDAWLEIQRAAPKLLESQIIFPDGFVEAEAQ